MNKFGGKWTKIKIDILVDYAKAYLTIMQEFANRYQWELVYFDGFAGSGEIQSKKGLSEIKSAAIRILELDHQKKFDIYYFVEKDKNNSSSLRNAIKNFDQKKYVVEDDCSKKIHSLTTYVKNHNYKTKVLAYIDPFGMQVSWDSIKNLGIKGVDVFILVPTGIGVTRMLKGDGNISEPWIQKLESFLGMDRKDIINYFYAKEQTISLFEQNESKLVKKEKTAHKVAELYKNQLQTVFKYVSKPFMLKNKNNSVMFHYYMVSQNRNAVRIANDIIKKYNKNG